MRGRITHFALALLGLHAATGHALAQQRLPGSLLVLRVLDQQGHPLARALVSVGGTSQRDATDDQGEVRIRNIPPGNRLVEVSRVGYAFTRIGAEFFGRDTVQREVRLDTAPIELDGITATSWGRSMSLVRSGFYDRQRRGLGAYMDPQRLAWVHPYRTSDAFRYMRGFTVVPVGHGTRNMVMSTRSAFAGGACVPVVYLDGSPMGGAQADALDMVPPDDLEAIEAYAGAATIPAEYNPTGNACGAILLWTRHGRN